jgi:hypothetical protein
MATTKPKPEDADPICCQCGKRIVDPEVRYLVDDIGGAVCSSCYAAWCEAQDGC